MPSFFGTSCGLLLFALCCSSIHYALQAATFYYRAQKWNVTSGNITTHRLAEQLYPEGGGGGRGENSFCDVVYNYSVDGVYYSGRRANVWGDLDEVRFCDFIDVKANIAANVNVFYNPSKPNESVLDRRIRPWSLASIVFTTVSLAYASFMVLLFDNVFHKLHRLLVSFICFLFVLGILVFCQSVRQLTKCNMAVCTGFSTAVFSCFAFTYWLLSFDDSDYLMQDFEYGEMMYGMV